MQKHYLPIKNSYFYIEQKNRMRIINGFFIGAVVILLSVFFTTTGCKKTPTPVTPPAPTPVTTYTFNAFGVTATGVQYVISNPTTGPLQITGTNGNGDQKVTITISSAVNSVGSYTLSATNNNAGNYTSGTNTIRYSTGASPYVGTLNITKYDATNRLMSVSFNFNAQEYFPNASSSGTINGSFDNIGF
jgi:hypothetical protein